MKPHSSISEEHTHGKADYIGITGSILCLVHCLVTPALAVGSSLATDHHMEGGFFNLDYIFIVINGIAVYYATRDHKLAVLRVFMWCSFLLFSVSLLLETHTPSASIMGYVGSGLLIAGHAYNLVYCRPWIFGR